MSQVALSPEENERRVQQCVARNEAPVKLQHIKPLESKKDAGAAATTATTSAPQSGAPTPGQQPGKSKRQQRREQKQQRAVGLCSNFVLGKCTYGAKCRENHDLAAFLAARLPDLPGSCPFSSTGACPYSVTCRWACSHASRDDLHTQLRASIAKRQAAAAAAPSQAAVNGSNTASNGAANALSDGTAGAQEPAQQQPLAAEPAPQAASDVPEGVVTLPVGDKVEAPLNALRKEVQQQLWKNRYDYSRADGVLKDLGLRLSFKPTKAAASTQGAPGQAAVNGAAAPAAAAAATAAAGAEQGADTAAAVAAAATDLTRAAAEEEGAAAAGGTELEGPAAKRARTDAGGPTSLGAVAEVGAAAAAAPAAGAPADGDGDVTMKGPEAVAGGSAGAAGLSRGAAAKAETAAAHVEVPLRREEKRVIDFRGKTVLAPLTTVGNLPFRRVCKTLGADVTIGEMALCTNLLQGQASEWALLKRHPSEDLFGVQIAGGFPDAVARACQLIDESTQAVDFVDINMGCPIDIVCDRGAGSALLLRPKKIADIARAADRSMSLPLTLKTRKGYYDDQDVTHTFVDQIRGWGPIALTLHGRTRQQRYSRQADWQYIQKCAQAVGGTGLQLIGNGDVCSFTDWNEHVGSGEGPLTTCMIGRGALIKPWVFTEIREQRHWDISAGERLELLKGFCSAGLEHWGSDTRGLDTTRKFLLEWLSYTHRYIPVGLLEVVPQKLHWRAPPLYGRSDLETLLGSDSPSDWIRISEMLLGPAPPGFTFTPKHKSNAYSSSSAAPAAVSGATGAGYECDDQAEG